MRRLALVAVVLAASPARADTDETVTDTGELVPQRLTAKLVGTRMQLDVRFALTTVPTADERQPYSVFVPSGGAITGAIVTEGAHVERLRLEPAGTVETTWDALLTTPGPARRWAVKLELAASRGAGLLQVLAPRRTRLTLDVTIDAVTCFVDDARYVKLPHTWVAKLPRMPRRDTQRFDEICNTADDGAWYGLAAGELARKPAGEPRLGVAAGRLALPAQHFAQLELDVATKLGDTPRDLYTVLVVDHSRSLSAEERDNQRAIVGAYLRAAPRGRVQVIAYARHAHPLLPGWTVAGPGAKRIERALQALAPRNGSNVDVALAAAGDWLAGARGTRRLIVLTDDRLAQRLVDLPTAELRGILPASVLVHVVSVTGSSGELVRDETSPLAPLARETKGIAMRGGLDEDHPDLDATSLVRPTTIDQLSIVGAGWELGNRDACGEQLAEGRSCRWVGAGSAASGPITIEGWIWGTKLTRIVRPDPSQGRSVARALSTLTEFTHAIQPEVHEAIAHAAMAVNSVWSLLAVWGPPGGYKDAEWFGTIGLSGFGCCSGHGPMGTGIASHIISMSSQRPTVERQLRGAVLGCHPTGEIVLDIEITHEEIVDVTVTPKDARDHAVTECIANAIWDTSLALTPAPSRSRMTFPVLPI